MKKAFLALTLTLIAALALSLAGCGSKGKTPEVQPDGFLMLQNYKLAQKGRDDYKGYVGVKITVGDKDISVTMLGRIGKHMQSGHELYIVDETKSIVANVKLTNAPDAFWKGIAYAALADETVLKAGYSYYIVSKEADGDFWYGERTSVSQNAYFSIDGVVMSDDLYTFGFMQNTENRVLGPVDIVFKTI